MRTICRRLHRGDDLMGSIRAIAQAEQIAAGVILSGVGCVSRARIRDASGVQVRELDRDFEIVSLNGTVSQTRCHVHIALADESLATIGGHLLEGCIINTTCELVIGVLEQVRFGVEQDEQTGYDEIIFLETAK